MTLGVDAVWSWFHGPTSIYDGARTYIAFTDGRVTDPPAVWVGVYNHGDGTWTVGKLGDLSTPDDHSVPGIALRQDGRIVACWCEHPGSMFARVSTNPFDPTSWGPIVTVAAGKYTYANLHWLHSEQRFYLFARKNFTGSDRGHVFWTSPDGETWSAETLLINPQTFPYTKYSVTADRIDLAITTSHPELSSTSSLYHFQYSGGAWRTTDGTPLGPPPFNVNQGTLVHDGSANSRAWVWDIAPGPVIAYTNFPSADDHRYRYARWDGDQWVTSEITPAGGTIDQSGDDPHYSGGIALDHQNPNVVYLSRQVGSAWQLERWQTEDGGISWTSTVITPNPTVKNCRPMTPVGGGPVRVWWWAGTYNSYTSYDTELRSDPELTPGETPPPPPPVATAEIRTHVTWLSCALVSGNVIAELPELTGTISRVIGAYTSSSLTLPIPLAGPGALPRAVWEPATQPGTTMLVAIVNDIPTWGGIVLTRRGGTGATLDLGCVSLEGYLDRRYVRDHQWNNVDEASVIARGLVEDAQIDGINLVLDIPPTGTRRDRSYAHTDDATVYSRLQELMAVEGGPEWTIDLDWTDETRTAIAKIFRMRKRLGKQASPPDAVFQITASSVFASRGASEATYEYVEDYSDGRGANHVIAVSTGEGEDRPESSPVANVLPGWPRYERRITPSTSITDKATLDAHAAAELALRLFGARTWQITTRWDAYPRYGVDWQLGDDVAWDLVGHRHADGVQGQGRVIGFELDLQAGVMRPILYEPDGVS